MCVAPRGYVLCTWLRGIHCVPLRGATALRACSTTWARMATAGAANATAWALLARACDASHFHALAVLLLVDASQMFSLWLVRGCTVRSICHIKLTMLCVVGCVLSVVCCRHVRCEGLGSRGTCVSLYCMAAWSYVLGVDWRCGTQAIESTRSTNLAKMSAQNSRKTGIRAFKSAFFSPAALGGVRSKTPIRTRGGVSPDPSHPPRAEQLGGGHHAHCA